MQSLIGHKQNQLKFDASTKPKNTTAQDAGENEQENYQRSFHSVMYVAEGKFRDTYLVIV